MKTTNKLVVWVLLTGAAFMSCKKKEETFCWKCTVTHEKKSTGFYSQSDVRLCDRTASEIRDYQNATVTEGAAAGFMSKANCAKD